MKKYLNAGIRRPLGCLIFLFAACNQSSSYQSYKATRSDTLAMERKAAKALDSIIHLSKQIHTGDLVLRTGNDFTSESLRSLNQRNQQYSHCGIASIENDSIFVYHALGGEWNPDQKIKRDYLPDFADPYNNKGIGIFSFDVQDSVKQKIAAKAIQLYQQGIMFDLDFDLKTDERMYCAEYVCKTIETGTHQFLRFPRSHIKEFEFIGVDDLFLHPKCLKRVEIVYK